MLIHVGIHMLSSATFCRSTSRFTFSLAGPALFLSFLEPFLYFLHRSVTIERLIGSLNDFSVTIFMTFLQSRDMNEIQNALQQFRAHPDWRQIAAFFLGWAFFSGVRHAWYACFLRKTVLAAALGFCQHSQHDREPPTDVEKNTALSPVNMREVDRMQRPGSEHSFFVFLLLAAFTMSSLTQFFSLLVFGRVDGNLCTISLALGVGGSIGGRVIGLLIMSLELKHHFDARFYELAIYWFLLLSVLGVTAGTIYFSLGRIVIEPDLNVPICVKRHFMPTSLASSLSLILLESYTIFRMLYVLELPRGLLDIRMHQVLALLLLDLAVLIPDAISTNVLGDFIPFSAGTIVVLSVFASHRSQRQTRATSILSAHSSHSSLMGPTVMGFSGHNLTDQGQRSIPGPQSAVYGTFVNGLTTVPNGSYPTPGTNTFSNSQMDRVNAPAIELHMPQPISLIPLQLSSSLGVGSRPHSRASSVRSSVTRDATSIENAVVQTATRQNVPPGFDVHDDNLADARRYGKILPSQSQIAEAMNRENPDGLAPPPRSIIRPRLYVDTSKVQRTANRVSFMEIASFTPEGYLTRQSQTLHQVPKVLDVASHPIRANMSPLTVMRSPSTTIYSPGSVSETHQSMLFLDNLGGNGISKRGDLRKSSRVSQAPTFGRSRSTAHPNVPVTPDSSLQNFPIPPPWTAQPVRPLKIVRRLHGPRDRLPTSAPPM